MQQVTPLEQTKEEGWLETMFSPANGELVSNHNGVADRYVVSDGNKRIYKSTMSGTPVAILSWEEATKLAELIISMGDKAIVFRLETI